MNILFQIDTFGTAPAAVREHLLLDAGGMLVYQVSSPRNPENQNHIGTWSGQLDAAGLAAAQDLAAALAALPPVTVQQPRGGPDRRLTLHPSGAARSFSLFSEDPLPPTVAEAAALAARFEAFARQHAFAVLQFEARLRRQAEVDQLVFVFSNPGQEPVEFLLDGEAVSLRRPALGPVVWRNLARPRVGLMSQAGLLLDGLLVPASLGPGDRASMAFRLPAGILPVAPAQIGPAWSAAVTGAVSLLVPGTSTPPFPETPFRLAYTAPDSVPAG